MSSTESTTASSSAGAGAEEVADGAGRLFVSAFKGNEYGEVLRALHAVLRPRSYLEVGTLNGRTLAMAQCASVAVDPAFQINTEIVGKKPLLLMRQCGSDEFFAGFDPAAVFGTSWVDLFFLDGMHLYEYLLRDFMNAERFSRPNSVIALHDCMPSDLHMTFRLGETSDYPLVYPGWWTGDVWRLLPMLKKYRPDLRIHCLDAYPTGLVLVTGLDPHSRVLHERYCEVVEEGMALDLAEIGLRSFLDSLPVRRAQEYLTLSQLSRHFWL